MPRSSLPLVTPGEPIPADPGCLRGHGTLQREDGTLIATVAGVIERVNKLVSVRPIWDAMVDYRCLTFHSNLTCPIQT